MSDDPGEPSRTEKFCVFCGQAPTDKNKEHVLPQWLLKMTGNPNRNVYLGRDWSSPKLTERFFSLKTFTFPACEKCNSSYSSLEQRTEKIVRRMLGREGISAADIDVLLDWLDKVRIGLWLGSLYLNKNFRGTSPQFYITSRIAAKDRLVLIYRDLGEMNGIAIAGTESPIFQVMPSVFVLSVNDLHFFSASAQDLLARTMGLPYLINKKLPADREGILADIAPGTEKLVLPIPSFPVVKGGVGFYQPMVPSDPHRSEINDLHYDSDYTRAMCADHGPGRGAVFYVSHGECIKYPSANSLDWIPTEEKPKLDLLGDLGLMSGAWLEQMYTDVPDLSDLSEEQVEFVKKSQAGVIKLHQLIMTHLSKQFSSADHIIKISDRR